MKDTVAESLFRHRKGRRPAFLQRSACRILMYHAVGQVDPSRDRMGLCVTPETFDMQMRWIKERELRVTPLPEVVETITSGREMPRGSLAITFDDGYQGVLTHALSILKACGFPATLFANIGFLERTIPAGPYWFGWPTLTWDELATLHREGVGVGSHAMTHERLDALSQANAAEEIARSKALLEQRLRVPVTLFSYPHGAFDGRTVRLLKASGFSSACSSIEGVNDATTNPFALRRTEITAFDDTPAKFEKKLLGCYDWLRLIR